MAILKIARMGHPALRRPAEEVADPVAPEIAALIVDMFDTMIDARGLGLAAPQVHVSKRVVMFRTPGIREKYPGEDASGEDEPGEYEPREYGSREYGSGEYGSREYEEEAEDTGWSGLTVLINPVVEPIGDERGDGWEGCLSLPGLRGLVPRYRRIRYRGTAPDGALVEREAEGLHARVVQHECDHLDGILYPLRMTDLSKLIFESEFRHFHATEEECVA